MKKENEFKTDWARREKEDASFPDGIKMLNTNNVNTKS